MLRKFNITINGKEYLVEMEEIGGHVSNSPEPSTLEAAPIVEPAEKQAVIPAVVSPASETASKDAMTSPMPGTILKILVSVGDEVKENQPLLILEAMKMENEVVATKNGKVSAMHVALGQIVNAGDALITIV